MPRKPKLPSVAKPVRKQRPASQSPRKPAVSSFRKFAPREFAEWKNRSRTDMIEEVVARHGVKNYSKQDERYGFERYKPIQIITRGSKGYPGSYRFYLKAPGKRPYSLGIQVDIDPIPTREEMNENPRWWRKSEHYLKIVEAMLPYESKYMEDLMSKMIGQRSEVYSWFVQALQSAGFRGYDLGLVLEKQLGPEFLISVCEKYFLHSAAHASAFLKGFDFVEFNALTEEQRELLEKGHLMKVYGSPNPEILAAPKILDIMEVREGKFHRAVIPLDTRVNAETQTKRKHKDVENEDSPI